MVKSVSGESSGEGLARPRTPKREIKRHPSNGDPTDIVFGCWPGVGSMSDLIQWWLQELFLTAGRTVCMCTLAPQRLISALSVRSFK